MSCTCICTCTIYNVLQAVLPSTPAKPLVDALGTDAETAWAAVHAAEGNPFWKGAGALRQCGSGGKPILGFHGSVAYVGGTWGSSWLSWG